MTLIVKNKEMSESDTAHYKTYLTLVRSVRSRDDAKLLADVYSSKIKDEDLIKIVDSLVECSGSKTVLGVDEFADVIECLGKFVYRDDAREYVQKVFRRTVDQVQRHTIMRLIGFLPPKMQRITMKQFNDHQGKNKIVQKICPHCQRVMSANEDVTYVVCGYGEKGYDWEGCQKDWCFRCGKKLCKSWFKDDLFNEQNRVHNDRCCRLYAYKNKESFRKNYCACDKIHINHKL